MPPAIWTASTGITAHFKHRPAIRRSQSYQHGISAKQDWMTDEQLTDLWTQIDRTVRPGGR
ncbi:MAG: hypothetical protein AAFV69_09670, partial [Pseudomonadota bacterium]